MSFVDRILKDVENFRALVKRVLKERILKAVEQGDVKILEEGGARVIIRDFVIPRLRYADVSIDADTDANDPGGEGSPSANPGDVAAGSIPGAKPGVIIGKIGNGSGKGNGEEGEDGEEGQGAPSGGKGRGGISIALSNEEFYALLAEALNLPRMKPVGDEELPMTDEEYSDISLSGTQARIDWSRTVAEALKHRSIISVPLDEDYRYRFPEDTMEPQASVNLIFLMDVSGSVSDFMRRLIRMFVYLCLGWVKHNYAAPNIGPKDEVAGIKEVYIIHTTAADFVGRTEFFGSTRSGGTVSSTAHKLAAEKLSNMRGNSYVFYFSDGMNWERDDVPCAEIIKNEILPKVQLYGYFEIDADRPQFSNGSGVFGSNFRKVLENAVGKDERVVIDSLRNEGDVIDAFVRSFGDKKGR